MLNALILQLFGIYAADILVIVTAVLAGLTGFYAIQTMKTVQIMERAAKMEFLPRIKGHIHMNG